MHCFSFVQLFVRAPALITGSNSNVCLIADILSELTAFKCAI